MTTAGATDDWIPLERTGKERMRAVLCYFLPSYCFQQALHRRSCCSNVVLLSKSPQNPASFEASLISKDHSARQRKEKRKEKQHQASMSGSQSRGRIQLEILQPISVTAPSSFNAHPHSASCLLLFFFLDLSTHTSLNLFQMSTSLGARFCSFQRSRLCLQTIRSFLKYNIAFCCLTFGNGKERGTLDCWG